MASYQFSQIHQCPIFIELNLDHFEGPRWFARKLLNTSGWLQVVSFSMTTPLGHLSKPYVIGCNDDGVTTPQWEVDLLFALPMTGPQPTHYDAPPELGPIAEMARFDFMGECDGLALDAVAQNENETRQRLSILDRQTSQTLTDISHQLAKLRSDLRQERFRILKRRTLRAEIESAEAQEACVHSEFIAKRRNIRGSAIQYQDALLESITYEADAEVLLTVQFEARMRSHERTIAWPLIQEEPYSAGWSAERAQLALKDHLDQAASRRAETIAEKQKQAKKEEERVAAQKEAHKNEAAITATELAEALKEKKPTETKPRVLRLPKAPAAKPSPPVEVKEPTEAEKHAALRAEVAALSDELRLSGRRSEAAKQGLWRVTRRKQPQEEELQAVYHALGQIEGATERFPRILEFLSPPPPLAPPLVKSDEPKRWALRAEQIERIANSRRLLSPKSKVALGKLKSGQTNLTDADRNAMKHLFAQLKKTGFDIDGFLAVK